MSEMTEKVASAMYWDRVDPDLGVIVLDVAVTEWEAIPDEHTPGIPVWLCKQFWRDAARSAIEAMREPTNFMSNQATEKFYLISREVAVERAKEDKWDGHRDDLIGYYQNFIDAALQP